MRQTHNHKTEKQKTDGCRCEELSGEALAEDMRRFAQEKLAKPGEALAFLVRAGLVDSSGKLTEPYK